MEPKEVETQVEPRSRRHAVMVKAWMASWGRAGGNEDTKVEPEGRRSPMETKGWRDKA